MEHREPLTEPQMKNSSSNKILREQPYIEVYANASILIGEQEEVKVVWNEGKQTKQAQERYERIKKVLNEGFLKQKIEDAKSPETTATFLSALSSTHKDALEKVVESLSAQEGRALVDILILQLTIKAIASEQDVRLHKANKGSEDGSKQRKKENQTASRTRFSWAEGISMRNLDRVYIVPILREYGLLRMNPDGAFMTRSFSENYPYSQFYKAEIIGAKRRWLEIIDALEDDSLNAENALLYILDLLWKSSENFQALTVETTKKLNTRLSKQSRISIEDVTAIIKQHIDESQAPARLLEIAIHTLLQALEDADGDLGGTLKPLMAMRNANQKNKNIGDVEVTYGTAIVEAWDAKYGVMYLGDDINALEDKFVGHNVSELVFGYVVYPEKRQYPEIDRKIALLEEEYGIEVDILLFDEWTREQMLRAGSNNISEERIASLWLTAYVESLALKRPLKAPIDEPTFSWLQSIGNIL